MSRSQPQRPYKVWSADRQTRKSVIAGNLNEFKLRAAEKLGYRPDECRYLNVVLESDGTEVEDDAYFQSAEKDTVFLLLRDNEIWLPPGIDALKSALSAIPQIVCDTINSLNLANKPPAWSIKDDQGYITVTLQWERGQVGADEAAAVAATGAADGPAAKLLKYHHLADGFDEPASWRLFSSSSAHPGPSSSASVYGDKIYSSTFPRSTGSSARARSYESYLRCQRGGIGYPLSEAYRSTLPYHKTLSADDFSFIDRTVSGLLSAAGGGIGDDLSSAHDLTSYCDFHCSSLHRDGGSIKVSKSVGTSPILDFGSRTISPVHPPPPPPRPANISVAQLDQINNDQIAQQQAAAAAISSLSATTTASKAKKGPVRFMDYIEASDAKRNISLMGLINGHSIAGLTATRGGGGGGGGGTASSSESETETTERDDDEEQMCERYLLLVDQLSGNHKRHLNIKDIGIILERLKSKIVDIDKLERDKETIDCYNWLIKATIRGEMLREVGVLYHGQYYSLMEHPGYF